MSSGEKIEDGGPAFAQNPPLHSDGESASGYPYPHPGMSLRDYFAAAALQGLLGGTYHDLRNGNCNAETAARAYRLADAMLKARQP